VNCKFPMEFFSESADGFGRLVKRFESSGAVDSSLEVYSGFVPTTTELDSAHSAERRGLNPIAHVLRMMIVGAKILPLVVLSVAIHMIYSVWPRPSHVEYRSSVCPYFVTRDRYSTIRSVIVVRPFTNLASVSMSLESSKHPGEGVVVVDLFKVFQRNVWIFVLHFETSLMGWLAHCTTGKQNEQ